MEKLGLNELREKFLSFYESKGHLRLPSFSLIPKNDASLLLINSGMAPLKPYFKGTETPPRRRVTTCQKCIRTPDIENVGKTARHGTFFEMLGNFSFGDYFKNEAITWAWEFLTKVLEIPADRLYITIYKDDDEAFEIWNKKVGVPADRIFRLGKEDNFWEHGTGPCGPCSEIHFDRGPEYSCGENCHFPCECDRYIEIWNLVFTQFDKQEDGSYPRLAKPNIDTGMGLERLACVMQGVDNLFEVDTVRRILDNVCMIAGVEYGKDWKTDVSIRVITDHIRSTVMMISDGVVPSNEGRGYVLRRLLRRAARHGRMLGVTRPFLTELAEIVIEDSCGAYPNLVEKRSFIMNIIANEEEKFSKTINQGMNILGDFMKDAGKEKVLPGSIAFKLHDTYGFPFDLTKEILTDNGFEIDEEGFRKEMAAQRALARENMKNKESSWASNEVAVPDDCPKTEFTGYEKLEDNATVMAILSPSKGLVRAAEAEDEIILVTDRTPFYAESGGQEGDSGMIETNTGAKFFVENTTKTANGKWRHAGVVTDGTINVGETVKMKVDRKLRLATERNHSATHLLQKALRTVLGDQVHQAGSSVNSDRLRFDFNHVKAVTPEELAKVEEIVNEAIFDDLPVHTDIMDIESAKATGAMALFGEKYGDSVRVVSMGDFSKELCGGTHVKNTASIGCFKIVHESAVASGTRRIEAVTGTGARKFYEDRNALLAEASESAKASPSELASKINAINAQLKDTQKELKEIKDSIAGDALGDLLSKAENAGGISVVTGRFDLQDMGGLRELAEKLRDKAGCSLVLLASGKDDKVSLVAMASKDAVEKGANCGKIIKFAASECGGGGGGRPDMAQAGGKNVAAIDGMLKKIAGEVASSLK